MTTDTTDVASYLRGRMFIHGVTHRTPLPVALDVLTTLVVDVPRDSLEEWRSRFDAALAGVPLPEPARTNPTSAPVPARRGGVRGPEVADRATWGLLPEHQADLRKVMSQASGLG
jgi:hypothetical protein